MGPEIESCGLNVLNERGLPFLSSRNLCTRGGMALRKENCDTCVRFRRADHPSDKL